MASGSGFRRAEVRQAALPERERRFGGGGPRREYYGKQRGDTQSLDSPFTLQMI